MIRSLFGLALLAGVIWSFRSPALAQEKLPPPKKTETPREEYSEFFTPPETVPEFWRALQFELEVGRYELAAKLLHGLIARNPSDEDLLKLEEKSGTGAFLRLQTVPRWSENPAINKQAINDAKELADRLGAALQKILGDPKRIGRFIKNLTGDREEQSFAARELYRSRAQAIPELIAQFRTGNEAERAAILALLPRLAPETAAPLAAALEIPDNGLRLDLIQVLVRHAGAREAIPELWFLAASPQASEGVRTKAREALAYLLEKPLQSLPSAQEALTHLAENFYQHRIAFPDSNKVVIWRWDDKAQALVRGLPGLPQVNSSRAEEYYGLRYARQALVADPRYATAQELFLSLALDKGMERAGLDQPLAKAAPAVQDLLATVNPDLVVRVLGRALDENRLPVILGAVRALAELEDTRANRPKSPGGPTLLRALNYPDRRVQMAAAEAFLRTPAVPAPNAAGRVVEVLRRSAAIGPEVKGPPKVLVGFADEVVNDAVGRAVQAAGFDAVKVSSGRQALKRLWEAAPIDALLIDVNLPDPGLAWLLSQLRGDVGYGQLPLWLVLPGDTQDSLLEERLNLDRKLAESRIARGSLMQDRIRIQHQLLKAEGVQEITLKKELERIDQQLAFYSLEAENSLRKQLQQIDRELLKAPRDRSLTFHRLAQKYPNVWILSRAAALDPGALKRTLSSQLAEEISRPLPEAVRKDYVERALGWLARMARGEMAGYDVRPVEEPVLRTLRSPGFSDETQIDALEILSRLSSAKSQFNLAETTLDGKRSLRVRSAAARALVRNIQQFNSSLPSAEVEALNNLFAARETDPALKASVALVLGSLRPDHRLTAERLKAYDPTVAPVAPVPPGPGPTPSPPKE